MLGVARPDKAPYQMNHEEFNEFKVLLEKLHATNLASHNIYGAPMSSSFIKRMGH
jgi:hypothetical protein